MEIKGLTSKEVSLRIKENKTNITPKDSLKTNGQIICHHVFTLFNFYSLSIAIALLSVQAYSSLFFIFVMFSNTIMFIIQEIKARNLISQLNIIVSPKTRVIRDGHLSQIDHDAIVLDDVIFFEAGDQISTDAVILNGYMEVNESMLTGEVKVLEKGVGDQLFSGTYVVSGSSYARASHVGLDNYANKITLAIKTNRENNSELLRIFKKVTKITSIFVIPIASILLYQGLFVRMQDLKSVVVNSSSALLGMLPQGLVLLTTISLMASALKLGSRKTLIQDLYAIETLSQADVLCLDKTGTLTKGEMTLKASHQIHPDFEDYVHAYINDTLDNNATSKALKAAFQGSSSFSTLDTIPFVSERKFSALNLDNGQAFILGAPEILAENLELPSAMAKERSNGARIILAGRLPHHIDKDFIPKNVEGLVFLAIQDPIREDAKSSLDFFKENDVEVKIFSGDNLETVASIARQAGLVDSNKTIDARNLKSDKEIEYAVLNYNVFGRATPQQKLKFVEVLQKHGNKVAMTGDGINDVLALKKADCSIAMGEGSDAALNIAQVVIMDGKLSTLVDVVKEGRQVMNHITRSASMYYLRTILTFFVSFISIALNVPFPFIPFQITLTNMFVDGFPSFMLLFENNIEKPKESLFTHVLRHSVPNAVAIIFFWFILNLFNNKLQLNINTAQTMMYFLNGYISIHMIYRIYKPLNFYRLGVLIIDFIGFLVSSLIFWPLLELDPLSIKNIQSLLVFALLSNLLVYLAYQIILKLISLKTCEKTTKLDNA